MLTILPSRYSLSIHAVWHKFIFGISSIHSLVFLKISWPYCGQSWKVCAYDLSVYWLCYIIFCNVDKRISCRCLVFHFWISSTFKYLDSLFISVLYRLGFFFFFWLHTLGFLTLCKFPCIIMMETKMLGYGYGYGYWCKDTTFFLKNFGYDTSGMNNMFTMMNTLYLKRMHTNQKEMLIDWRKSQIEIQCVKPQIQDQTNKILTSKDFTRSKGLSISSKILVLHSCQINYIRHVGTISKCLKIFSPTNSSKQRVERLQSLHHPLNPKQQKNFTP